MNTIKITAKAINNYFLILTFDHPYFTHEEMFIQKFRDEEKLKHHPTELPFVLKIYQLTDDITEISALKNELKLKKISHHSWMDIAPEIAKILRKAIENDEPLFSKQFSLNLNKNEKDSNAHTNNSPHLNNLITQNVFQHLSPKRIELLKVVDDFIEERIRPGLAQHGGNVFIVNYREDDLTLIIQFSGGCQGCSQSSVTVKDGIEKLLQNEFDFIQKIEDGTSHHEGQNPYFS